MTIRAFRWAWLLAAVGLFCFRLPAMGAEEGGNQAALAAALKEAAITLQDGLRASAREGTPISAKFEIDEGKLRLSVYVIKGGGFSEVVVDPKSGAIVMAEKITEGGDLKDATAQKAAMAKAKKSLLAAADAAAKAEAGFRVVSVFPVEREGHALADLVLLHGTTFKKITEKLD